MVSVAMLAILLVSGALPISEAYSSSLPASGAVSSSSRNTIQTSSTTLGAASATSVGTAGKFLSGPFRVTPTFGTAPADPASSSSSPHTPPSPNEKPLVAQATKDPGAPPIVSCPSAGCDNINTGTGGALTNPTALNVVDSTTSFSALSGVPGYTIEPPDYAVCASGQYVIEALNIGELQVYGASTLAPVSKGYATLDSVMGLASHAPQGWSSAGDPSCYFDYSNGGHWFITEFVSATPEKPLVKGGQPGPFQGCFVGVPFTCLEGIAVSLTSNPLGSYNVYFVNPNKVNNDPGAKAGVLLNDFAKIGTTQDAFLLFYDEFNLGIAPSSGFGSHGFNGAQEFAFNKNSLENGVPAKSVTVAYENMGTAKNLYPVPANGAFQPVSASCASGTFAGLVCWFEAIPAQSPDPSQFDHSHGGTGFMVAALDFFGAGDDRVAVFDWTGLSDLNSAGCSMCKGIQFGGQIITSGVSYLDEGAACLVQFGGFCGLGNQKAGPIPLGNFCGPLVPTISASCPESGIATNGDSATQVSFADGQLWTAISTQVVQIFGKSSELHIGATYWTIGTGGFDSSSKGSFSVTNEGIVSAAHEDIEMPAIVGVDTGGAIMTFTLSGKDFYPSTAFGTLTTTSSGLTGVIHIADRGMSPQDGFTEYQGFPGLTRARWGDYSWGVYVPSLGGVVFGTEYIQHPNCGDNAFLSSGGSCGGTRVLLANWGSSVNFIAT
ncbi:MAG: hypothetical protein ACRECH_01230 [Nitrososphaerales archaeon]